MRIKVKWTSCGHRKKMALLCFYDYTDGYRQSVGYLCRDCIRRMDEAMFQFSLQEYTWKVHVYRVIYPDRIGNVRIVIARVTGAEDIIPDAVMATIPTVLETGLQAVAQQRVPGKGGEADTWVGPPDFVIQGISFGVETGASPEDYKRR